MIRLTAPRWGRGAFGSTVCLMSARTPGVSRRLGRSGPVTAVLTLLLAFSSACGGTIPMDTEGSLDRATDGTLRVGVSANPPWVEVAPDGEVSGREAGLVNGFADEIGARVEWVSGAESELVAAAHHGDLDIVVGGLQDDSPWREEVALARHYAEETTPDGDTERFVMATRPGENALLVALESYLHEAGGNP